MPSKKDISNTNKQAQSNGPFRTAIMEGWIQEEEKRKISSFSFITIVFS